MGSLKALQIDVSEISTDTAHEVPDLDKGYQTVDEESLPPMLEKPGASFITSPTDVEEHRKALLKDFPITSEETAAFNALCKEYKDVFSTESKDIGKTPLITMDIDTGTSPPVCQQPYTMPLKHAKWVKHELHILESVGVIVHSVSPWATPLWLYPREVLQGNPPKHRLCINYRALNKLLPPIQKAFSNAKGILSLVPLPKIDDIYA